MLKNSYIGQKHAESVVGLSFCFFLSAALIYAATIEYSGLVDIYYRCGAYISDFGTCKGDCFGFITAVGSTTEKPPIRVYIGNTEVLLTTSSTR
jgi:hypothetical protein